MVLKGEAKKTFVRMATRRKQLKEEVSVLKRILIEKRNEFARVSQRASDEHGIENLEKFCDAWGWRSKVSERSGGSPQELAVEEVLRSSGVTATKKIRKLAALHSLLADEKTILELLIKEKEKELFAVESSLESKFSVHADRDYEYSSECTATIIFPV